MSACNMITMAEDLCGLLPAQTPVDPDQIKLFCSILNYMMHFQKKKKKTHFLTGRSLERVWDFWEPSGWCMAGAREAHSSTDEDQKLQGNELFGPEAVTAEGYCLLALSVSTEQDSSGLVLQKKVRAAFLPPCCAHTAPASLHCVRLLWAQWREQSS